MRRREFIALFGGATAWPLAASAQQSERRRRIGALLQNAESDLLARRYRTIFEQSLDKLGWTVGKNLLIDYRWSNSGPDEAKAAVTELLSLSPDLILANSLSAVRAARQATRSVPIVFTAVSEPVVQGFVKSLAHPGENITGFTNLEPSVAGKWLALLKEVAPGVTRVALIMNPASGPVTQLFYRAIETAAPSAGIETTLIKVYDLADIHMAMSRIGGQSGTGIIVPPDTFLGFYYKEIAELATRFKVPAIFAFRYYTVAGRLLSYGPDVADQFQRAAVYVDRIFRGEKPGDLPVQQPTKFEYVINVRAAKALGLTVPNSMLLAADEVIE
jgi:putative tryptophan/tyrosine transport system substrate-binding protein